MKKIITGIIFLINLASLFSVTVDGYAFLEGETDHSGIEVFLQRVAPDTNFDYTVYTDSTGYYLCADVEAGLYDVSYSKSYNFLPMSISALNLYSDNTIQDVILESKNGVFGSINGVLPTGEYEVTETLTIEQGDTLIIEPGVTLKFNQGTEFDIYGLLIAEGTESDNIVFTSLPGSNWNGITIRWSADDNTIINHAIIESSIDHGLLITYRSPTINNCLIRNNDSNNISGGVRITSNASPKISNCTIKDNFKAGLAILGSELTMLNTTISGNRSTGYGGIYCDDSELNILSSEISDNYGVSGGGIICIGSIVDIDSTIISNNENNMVYSHYSYPFGGLRIEGGSAEIRNSKIISNRTGTHGGGIISSGDVKISNSIISDNESSWNGGGIYALSGSITIDNSIIYSNTSTSGLGGGIFNNCDSFIVNNSVISRNDGEGVYSYKSIDIYNSIISNNSSYGVYLSSSSIDHEIAHCNVYSNTGSDFYNCNQYLGNLVTTNSNGDSCDPWFNISMDPMFEDVGNGDYRLQSGSPCIDAGTNTIDGYEFPIADFDNNYRIWDGDGNGSEIVDMGVYEYDSHSTDIDNEELIIGNYTLEQNYPNPFNPETTISYSLMNNAQVHLKVYDILGRELVDLVDSKQNKGSHEVKFNASMLTSGIYFYRLSVDEKVVSNKKMMLLK
ncbi:MAG: T9SS type A sorting domain-containing protein [Candidatus Delongbacteria bacterium]|nr:T9SS type A sorting domain-containing protein [Candidatus Delongbacteria bacterium]